jgi:hypothetical protein
VSLWVPPAPFTAMETNATTPASPQGTLVTASSTIHTKNTTYTQLIASTAFDAYGILVMFADAAVSGTATSILVDIAIGAAASETVIIPNLNAGYAQVSIGGSGGQKYWFPIRIPQGSRISATAQSLVASKTIRTIVTLLGRPLRPVWAGSQVIDYGTDLSLSKGVDVACGLSAAEGTWTQIVASTTQHHQCFAVGIGDAADVTVVASNNLIDIGVGAATETVIAGDQPFGSGSNETLFYWAPISVWTPVPSGERLTARISSHQASAQSYDVQLYGVS